jgi:hypothetical protein
MLSVGVKAFFVMWLQGVWENWDSLGFGPYVTEPKVYRRSPPIPGTLITLL